MLIFSIFDVSSGSNEFVADILITFSNEVSSIMERFQKWESELKNCCNSKNGLREMLRNSAWILQNPAFIYAPDGRALAISPDYPASIHWHWAEILKNNGLTEERMEKLQEHITETWDREKVKRREQREQRLMKERMENLPTLIEQELERYPSAGTMAFKTGEERDMASELFKKKGFLVDSYTEEDAYCVNYGHCEQDLYYV